MFLRLKWDKNTVTCINLNYIKSVQIVRRDEKDEAIRLEYADGVTEELKPKDIINFNSLVDKFFNKRAATWVS